MAILWSIFYLCLTIQVNEGQNQCLQVRNQDGLPNFQSHTNEDEIIRHHQAIIPSYKLVCNEMCGNITEWGVDVQRGGDNDNNGQYSLDLQVWRPSPTVDDTGTGCYSLVGNNRFTSITFTSNLVRVTPSAQDYIQFQSGDVLGFYVEDARGENDGVVVLDNNNFASESVWYASIAPTMATSQNGDCPYSIGSDGGVLNTLTQAAPVISIAMVTFPCPPLPSMATTQPTPPLNPTTDSEESPDIGLIIGIVVTVSVVIASIFTVVVISAVLLKRYGKAVVIKKQALANPTYSTKGGASSSSNLEHNTNSNYDYVENQGTLPGGGQDAAMYQEAVLYHSAGPDVSKPTKTTTKTGQSRSTGSKQSAPNLYEAPATQKFRGASDYELPQSEDVFDNAGFYVPTADERTAWAGNHYEVEDTWAYNKLDFFVEDQIYWAPASTTSDLYSQLASKKYREIPRNQIIILEQLGSGQFGQVHKALWSISGATKELAIKTLRAELPEEEKVRFLQEAAIMGQFSHPNVVKLYGVVTVGDPVMICLELLPKGDLREYLCSVHVVPDKHNARDMELRFLQFSKQIASGMRYLSKKSFVHRDLAARNVLLDDALNCKIGDFGMARDLMDETYYTPKNKGGKIPVKWTAPEALHYKKYSTDSDIWSYGMVLFEIWSVGKKPFSQFSNSNILRQINIGYNQPPPPGCPKAIYQLMVDCWHPVHSKRPNFSKICSYLKAPSDQLLQWVDEDASQRARMLGAPLSEAESLYLDLQNAYKDKSH